MGWMIDVRVDEAVAVPTREMWARLYPEQTIIEVPGGAQQIHDMAAQGIDYPEVLKAHLLGRPATLRMELEIDGCSFEFDSVSQIPHTTFFVTVRGRGNPWRILSNLQRVEGWTLLDEDNQPLKGPEGWLKFRSLVDAAVAKAAVGEFDD